MPSGSIKKVIVIGGSGSAGTPIVQALLDAGRLIVTILSRLTSKSTFPEGIKVIKTEYTPETLVNAFKDQDAVVSTITTFSVDQQRAFIDAAIEAGVHRFLPSEYGVDTSDRSIGEFVPPAGSKNEAVAYLKTKEATGLTWTATIVGAFFDSEFMIPGLLGWNIPEKKVTLFDGGDIEFEATNLAQIGR